MIEYNRKKREYLIMTLDKFLNLEEIFIQGYRHLENIGIIFRIESKNKKATCPRCGLTRIKNTRIIAIWEGFTDLRAVGIFTS